MGNVTSQSDSDETTGMPTEESDAADEEGVTVSTKSQRVGKENGQNRCNIVTRKQGIQDTEYKEPGVVTPLLHDNADEATVKRERVLAWEIDVSGWRQETSKSQRRYKTARQSVRRQNKSSVDGTNTKEKYEPPVVNSTQRMMAERKVLDLRRWFCISRPQYSKSCGLSSLVSCWNYLFSSLGVGSLQPITQEEALTVLGFNPPFGEIRFGPFTGNATLMRWFKQLNDYYNVRGRSYYLYKPHGKGRTMGRTSDEALRLVRSGLKDSAITFVYHCQNHYFCPIGYENVPQKAVHAYSENLSDAEVDTWILIGDTSRRHAGIQCVKWEDVVKDLTSQSPEYLNIRKVHLGIQKRKTKKVGGNLHCIMAFERSQWQGIHSVRPLKSETKADTNQEDCVGPCWTGSKNGAIERKTTDYGYEEEDVVVDVSDAESSADESLSSDD
ncbi:basic immunoglobulin-like variable motif-containing protein [Glandiceps talaboti]